jgi:predicted Zn-ribbon and HTH transcriptional regulator
MSTKVQPIDNSQHDAKLDVMRRYPLATKTGIEMMFAMLLHDGAMCPKCGYATRNTSKRWARCKKCGERVARNGA